MSLQHKTILLVWVAASCVPMTSALGADVDFNRDIRPILSDRCFHCHGPDASHREADLRFDVEDSAKALHDGAGAIVAGSAEKSEAFRRITSNDADLRMPPADTAEPLTQKEISLIRQWIDQGAKYEQHWAYRPVKKPAPPEVKDTTWKRNDVDAFILSRIERAGLSPSVDADPITLVRRLSFDLTGLPPAYEDVESFQQQPTIKNYEALVDKYLASSHFGERMAVHWLDLVRYADTVGYHGDQDHNISPYRDYVISAFNSNMPFDQFTIEQLAGDLLPNPTLNQKIATGYNRVLQTTHEGGAQDKEYLAKYAADRVRNVSGVWLGSTMGCAECHNHKFDPFTMEDFYSFQSFFADVQEQGAFRAPNSVPTRRLPEMLVLPDELQKQLDETNRQIEELQKNKDEAATDDGKKKIEQLKKQAEAIRKQGRMTMITVAVKPRTIRVLARGDWMDTTGKIVEPSAPKFLPQIEKDGRANRLDLANWLVSNSNPLTARVFANRIWKLMFGRGLSARLDDFGGQGAPPTHPELLDWLASDFRENNWDIKHLVKTVVMSRTYQQSSLPRPILLEKDPTNELLARQASFRLEAEFIRDNALAISGLLVDEIGGRPAKPYQPSGYYQHLNFPQRKYAADKNKNQYRRGVYMHWQRMFLHPMLKAFDAPTREECTAQRPISNTPLAALVLLNDPTFVEASRAFSERIIREGGNDDRTRIEWAWKTALSRGPSPKEMSIATKLLKQERQDFQQDSTRFQEFVSVGLRPTPKDVDVIELATWTSIARVLLNLNETITRN